MISESNNFLSDSEAYFKRKNSTLTSSTHLNNTNDKISN